MDSLGLYGKIRTARRMITGVDPTNRPRIINKWPTSEGFFLTIMSKAVDAHMHAWPTFFFGTEMDAVAGGTGVTNQGQEKDLQISAFPFPWARATIALRPPT